MILSNRHGYARSIQRACLPLSKTPHAESSGQASLRAAMIQSRSMWTVKSGWKGKEKVLDMPWGGARGMMYSAAALSQVDPSEDYASATVTKVPIDRYRRSGARHIDILPVDSNPFNTLPIHEIPHAFTSMSRKDPIKAFLSIRTITPERIRHLTPELFDTLFHHLIKVNPAALDRLTAFGILTRWMLNLQSAPPKSASEGYTPGSRFRGGRVIRWLQLCRVFKASTLLKKVFREVVIPELDFNEDTGPWKLVALREQVTMLIKDLMKARRYPLIIDLLAHRDYPTETLNIPLRLLDGTFIEQIMSAYLLNHEPYVLESLVELHAGLHLKPGATAYALLIQAYLEMGQVDKARELRKRVTAEYGADESGKLSSQLQLAILRGQRAMGLDADLQERVLGDLQVLELNPRPPFLHALIRERLEVNDVLGAKGLLDQFEMDFWRPGQGNGIEGRGAESKVWATDETYELAFATLCRKPRLEEIWQWWVNYGRSSRPISDFMVKSLVNALRVTGRGNSALAAVEAYSSGLRDVAGEEGSDESSRSGELNQTASGSFDDPNLVWVIPRRAAVGIHTVNGLLRAVLEQADLSNASHVTELMERLQISPNSTSLEIILAQIRSKTSARPIETAKLLTEMIGRAKDVQYTVRHLDILIHHAIQDIPTNSETKSRVRFSKTDIFSKSADSTAGSLPTDELGVFLAPYIEKLQQRGVPPTSKSMANRLEFEALSGGKSGDVPAAKLVWNEMIQRGFRPRHRHLIALMRGYVEIGALRDAQEVYRMAGQLNIPITRTMNMILLEGYLTGRYIGSATEIYEKIKYASDSTQRLDMPAVTSMIRGYYNIGHFTEAAEIAFGDLPALGVPYDGPAVSAASNAILLSGQPLRALKVIVDNLQVVGMSWVIRRILSRIRTRLRKKDRAGMASLEEKEGIVRIDGMLTAEFERRGREGLEREREKTAFEGLTGKRRAILGVEKAGSFGRGERDELLDSIGWEGSRSDIDMDAAILQEGGERVGGDAKLSDYFEGLDVWDPANFQVSSNIAKSRREPDRHPSTSPSTRPIDRQIPPHLRPSSGLHVTARIVVNGARTSKATAAIEQTNTEEDPPSAHSRSVDGELGMAK